MHTIEHWIDNESTPSTSGRVSPIYDPATGLTTAEVALGSVAEVDAAVASAKAAFPAWRDTPIVRRQRIMFAYRRDLTRRGQEIVEAISSQHGKTLDDAAGELQRGIEVVEFACGIPQR